MIHPRASLLAAVVVFAFAALLAGCGPAAPNSGDVVSTAPGWFEDVTDKVGLDFVHDPGLIDGAYFMPQIVGSGAALFDFDGDGRLDIYLLQNAGPKSSSTNRLFRQLPDGRFQDVSKGSGLDIAGWNMGVAIGDVNNDGRPDVLVTQYGGVKLFLNNGDGTFTDVSAEAGLHSNLWGTSAAFVDYDRDGWLDLVVVNYVDYDPRKCEGSDGKQDYCAPSAFPGSVTRLFHNLGAVPGGKPGAVRFEDVTLKSGLGLSPGPGLGVVCADFDGDGWPDIFVANDAQPNRLWINRRDGTFTDEAVARGLAYDILGRSMGNMGTSLADVDGDNLFDLFVTHLASESNTLWKQESRGLFQDRTAAAGLSAARWRGTGFGAAFGDFDQDGWPDLALVNGQVARRERPTETNKDSFWSYYAEGNQFFVNNGAGRFRDASLQNSAFCGTAAVSRGLAVGDVDGDGALDLLTTSVGGPARLYRNVAPNRGHWVLVQAVDPALHRDAYGAEIAVRAGGRRRVGWVNPGESYLCSSDPRVHFGLGATDSVDAYEVLWPDGAREVFSGGPADHVVTLRKGEGRSAEK